MGLMAFLSDKPLFHTPDDLEQYRGYQHETAWQIFSAWQYLYHVMRVPPPLGRELYRQTMKHIARIHRKAIKVGFTNQEYHAIRNLAIRRFGEAVTANEYFQDYDLDTLGRLYSRKAGPAK